MVAFVNSVSQKQIVQIKDQAEHFVYSLVLIYTGHKLQLAKAFQGLLLTQPKFKSHNCSDAPAMGLQQVFGCIGCIIQDINRRYVFD